MRVLSHQAVCIRRVPDARVCWAYILGWYELLNYRPEINWAVLAQPNWLVRLGWACILCTFEYFDLFFFANN